MHLDIIADSVSITGKYREQIAVEIIGADSEAIIEQIPSEDIFKAVNIFDFVCWIEGKGKASEILESMNADDVIHWLKENGHINESES